METISIGLFSVAVWNWLLLPKNKTFCRQGKNIPSSPSHHPHNSIKSTFLWIHSTPTVIQYPLMMLIMSHIFHQYLFFMVHLMMNWKKRVLWWDFNYIINIIIFYPISLTHSLSFDGCVKFYDAQKWSSVADILFTESNYWVINFPLKIVRSFTADDGDTLFRLPWCPFRMCILEYRRL